MRIIERRGGCCLLLPSAFFLVSASARHNVALSEMPGYNATGRGGNQPVKVANAFILHIEMCYARKNPGRVLSRGDTGANWFPALTPTGTDGT